MAVPLPPPSADQKPVILKVMPASQAAPKRSRVRRVFTPILVVLATLGLLASVVAVWAYRQALNTNVFGGRVDSILADPAVHTAMANYVTDQVMDAIDAPKLASEFLPPLAQPLVGPLEAAIRTFVLDKTTGVLASDTFRDLLGRAVRRAHSSAVRVLEGERVAGVDIQGDRVVLNVLPVVDQVLMRLAGDGLFGGRVTVPPIAEGDAPSRQIQMLATALGVQLPADFGQVTIFQSSTLSQAQDALKLLRKAIVVLLILTVVLIAAALLVSTNRMRTLAQLGLGLAVAMVILRVGANRGERRVIELVQRPENVDPVRAVMRVFTGSLDAATLWLLALGLVVAAVGFVFGRSDAAARLRAGVARSAARAGRAASGAKGPVTNAILAHTDGARVVAVAAGAVVLLWAGFTWSGVILAVALAVMLLVVIEVVVRRSPPRPAEAELPVAGDAPAG